MTRDELKQMYRDYISCLNAQDWPSLGRFVHDEAVHNGRPFGLAGYRQMLETDFRTIPDLVFTIDLLLADPPCVSARLWFDCSPRGMFLGLPVNGRRVSFAEHVVYRFDANRIREVWSVIDKSAIEAQL